MLNNTTDGILLLKCSSELHTETVVFCVCSLPPSESTRLNDLELLFSTLLEEVRSYQNEGRLIMCGDLNSRVWDAAE